MIVINDFFVRYKETETFNMIAKRIGVSDRVILTETTKHFCGLRGK